MIYLCTGSKELEIKIDKSWKGKLSHEKNWASIGPSTKIYVNHLGKFGELWNFWDSEWFM